MPGYKPRRYKLVCSGGGTRIAVFAGAVEFFRRQGWQVEEAIGTSAGAVCVAALASGKTPNGLRNLLKKITPSKILDPRIFSFWPFSDGTQSIIKGNKVLAAFRQHLKPTHKACKIPVHISTHNWTTGEQEIKSGGDLPLHVRASMSLPIFDMVEIDGDLYEDGGVSGNFHVDFTDWEMDTGAQVIALRILPSGRKRRKTPKSKLERLTATLSDIMDAVVDEKIEDAPGVWIVNLKSKHSGFDLGQTEEDIDDQFQEGYMSALYWWKNIYPFYKNRK